MLNHRPYYSQLFLNPLIKQLLYFTDLGSEVLRREEILGPMELYHKKKEQQQKTLFQIK